MDLTYVKAIKDAPLPLQSGGFHQTFI